MEFKDIKESYNRNPLRNLPYGLVQKSCHETKINIMALYKYCIPVSSFIFALPCFVAFWILLIIMMADYNNPINDIIVIPTVILFFLTFVTYFSAAICISIYMCKYRLKKFGDLPTFSENLPDSDIENYINISNKIKNDMGYRMPICYEGYYEDVVLVENHYIYAIFNKDVIYDIKKVSMSGRIVDASNFNL